jgi:RNA polymerase sigma-70 factor (ECF subfamily)
MSSPVGDVTVLLTQLGQGDKDAADRLIPLVYAELRRMAAIHMHRERPDHTLQPTALVHEAYLRLVGNVPSECQNRAHFFAIAAHSMREVLLDYARRHHAGKRGGENARKVVLDEALFISADRLDDVLVMDELLQRLAAIDARQSRLVELRFFAGMSVEEAGEVLDISPKTVKRDWRSAKAWLHRELDARAT